MTNERSLIVAQRSKCVALGSKSVARVTLMGNGAIQARNTIGKRKDETHI